jgi:predicted CoA-binding protein
METVELAREFLAHRRFAFVGVSRDPADFSRQLLRDLVARGYDVVPVTREAVSEVEGRRCCRRVQEIVPPVEAVLLMTAPAASEGVVLDCVEAGVKLIWFHQGTGAGSASELALAGCKTHGIRAITGACPYMYLAKANLVHRAHGFFRRRFGHWAA